MSNRFALRSAALTTLLAATIVACGSSGGDDLGGAEGLTAGSSGSSGANASAGNTSAGHALIAGASGSRTGGSAGHAAGASGSTGGHENGGGTSGGGAGEGSGGAKSAGASSGGAESGGHPSGGTSSGGHPSGGAASGGHPSGGAASGSHPSGGTSSGGAGGSTAVECNSGSDCAGFDPGDVCTQRSCADHTCGAYPSTSVIANDDVQTAGDCAVVVCDGKGGRTGEPDALDLPIDGNACTQDLCTGSKASNPIEAPGTPCGNNGVVCDASGQCGCQNNGDCVAPSTCGGGNPGTPLVCGCTKRSCVAAQATCGAVSDGCGGTMICDDGVRDGDETDVDCGGNGTCKKACAQSGHCAGNADCANGLCVDGVCCNVACGNACFACSAAKKGGGKDGECGAIALGDDPDDECEQGSPQTCGETGACDGTGLCAFYGAGSFCNPPQCSDRATFQRGSECDGHDGCNDQGHQDCAPFICKVLANDTLGCATSCAADSDCLDGYYCVGPKCGIKLPDGEHCSANNQCLSNQCNNTCY